MNKCCIVLVFQPGGTAYHVLNWRVGRLELFEKPADDSAFEKILAILNRQILSAKMSVYRLMPMTMMEPIVKKTALRS